MRYLIVLLLMGFFNVQAQQSEVDKLMRQGKALFGHELYNDAISKYEQALASDKKCIEAQYELAYTFLTIKDYDEALHYSRSVMSFKGEYYLEALLIYGAVLNENGNEKQAIREYSKALKKYPNEYLLLYNIAESYWRMKEAGEAEKALVKVLSMNKSHLPSHLMLSAIKKQQNEVLKSMLPIYYCLLLETDEAKKGILLEDLQVRWHVAMIQKPKRVAPVSKHSQQSGLEVAESKLNAIAQEATANNPDQPYKMVNQTMALLEMLATEQTGEMDFFDIHYVDFFKQLYIAGHAESFSYFINSGKFNPEVLTWVAAHQGDFSAFINWMELQQ